MSETIKKIKINDLPDSSIINDEDAFIKNNNIETSKVSAGNIAEYVSQKINTNIAYEKLRNAISENRSAIDVIENAITNKADADHDHDELYAVKNSEHSHGNKSILDTITQALLNDWNAAKNHSDCAHAPSDAEVNQNTFSNVAVGSATIAADSKTDTLTLVAGSNITLTPDIANNQITIASSGTVTNTITGVKGNNESTYRTGNINLTPDNIGAVNKTGDTMTGTLNSSVSADTLSTIASGQAIINSTVEGGSGKYVALSNIKSTHGSFYNYVRNNYNSIGYTKNVDDTTGTSSGDFITMYENRTLGLYGRKIYLSNVYYSGYINDLDGNNFFKNKYVESYNLSQYYCDPDPSLIGTKNYYYTNIQGIKILAMRVHIDNTNPITLPISFTNDKYIILSTLSLPDQSSKPIRVYITQQTKNYFSYIIYAVNTFKGFSYFNTYSEGCYYVDFLMIGQ